MAANTSPTSPWVESFDDKSNEWIQARIEHIKRQLAKQQKDTNGSVTKRKEVFTLSKLLVERLKQEQQKSAPAPTVEFSTELLGMTLPATAEELPPPPPSVTEPLTRTETR